MKCNIVHSWAYNYRLYKINFNYNYIVGCKHWAREREFCIGGSPLLWQFIEPVTFARCAFILVLQNITLGGHLDTSIGRALECWTVRLKE